MKKSEQELESAFRRIGRLAASFLLMSFAYEVGWSLYTLMHI